MNGVSQSILGYPINTPDDDIYIVFSKDGKRAYYSSVREDGMGYTDIYLITIPEGIKNVDPRWRRILLMYRKIHMRCC